MRKFQLAVTYRDTQVGTYSVAHLAHDAADVADRIMGIPQR